VNPEEIRQQQMREGGVFACAMRLRQRRAENYQQRLDLMYKAEQARMAGRSCDYDHLNQKILGMEIPR